MKRNLIYIMNDMAELHNMSPSPINVHILKSLEELLRRDEKRKEDGFPQKIRLGRLVKPSKEGKDTVVVIPTVVEEKFIHDMRPYDREAETGGSGEGNEGDIIEEEAIHSTKGNDADGSDGGEDAVHEIESSAYELGKIITEKFQLPNLLEKGSKRSLTKYTYDLTDTNRGFGQLLNKKATLKRLIGTNLTLGNISTDKEINPSDFLIAPSDKVYRILSKEKDYEAQAVVFFVRDYSGSMTGEPTNLIVSQHLLIYSWLMYQYESNVSTRFILHDEGAKEVGDFYTYYNSSVAGGTRIASAYRLINEIVHNENLSSDYNIYIFQGTDGEDWDVNGEEAIEELKIILSYVNRIGITIAKKVYSAFDYSFFGYAYPLESIAEKYLKKSGLLNNKKLIRLDLLKPDSDQDNIIEGIKRLVS